ncbi:SMI1/KNR4 family protein [Aureivirga sp. CE67]|uniref:SMI1/KNR4 family protein n=1 Tax=Aureivirga sp. CE67 TaxID=1788983 RepID=UPI0018C98BB6|nr:SMI1/KNR4 family protein [Aureivirga sp. CE67]
MMNIQYLKYYQENLEKINGGKYVVPFKENLETEIEIQIGYTFPLAYKEFIYLSIGQPMIWDSGINGWISEGAGLRRQKYVRENLLEYFNFKLDNSYWVIADLDGGEQFYAFKFNDPQAEDPENPPVYYMDADEKKFHLIFKTFSDFIVGTIRPQL